MRIKKILLKTRSDLEIAILCTVFLGSAACAQAATYYVDSARPDDSGTGTSWASAEKTISAGIAHLASGDILKIKSGSYASGLSIARSFSAETRIETDDGAGNPGLVSISGNINADSDHPSVVAYIHNTSYLTVDGRQPDGFTFQMSSNSHGIWSNSAGGGNNQKFRYLKINGTSSGSGADPSALSAYYGDNIEISNVKFDVSAGTAFVCQLGDMTGGSIHDCEVNQGVTSGGYAVFDVLRSNNVEVYRNYIHNVSASSPGSVYLRCRDTQLEGSIGSSFYNNVIVVDDDPYSIFQMRGYSDGSGGSDNNRFFNNTVIVSGSYSWYAGIVHVADDSDSNTVFNNLIVLPSNITNAIGCWNGFSGTANSFNNNIFINNGVTDANMLESCAELANGWTVAGNLEAQSISFMGVSPKPYPYWDIMASKDGIGTIPDYDFNGDARSDPPDVGAFEYSAGSPDTTPPSAPTGLAVR